MAINQPESRWGDDERALWARIEAHAFETPDIALDFTRRLGRQLGWPLETARGAIAEYRRFCFLAMVSRDGPVTPSEEVDEVWHMHLTFTRDYWERWCGLALGRRLHHDPTAGGPAEADRYHTQYAQTLALYERWFGPPPAAFWPGTAKRFAGAPRYRQIDTDRQLVMRRPHLPRSARTLMAAALAMLLGAAASPNEVDWTTTPNALDWSGTPFLELYAVLLAVAYVAAWVLNGIARTTGRRADTSQLDTLEIAWLAGGQSRAADTLLLELVAIERATIDRDGVWINPHAREAPARFEPFRSLPAGFYKRGDLLRLFAGSQRAAALGEALGRRDLFQSPLRRAAVTAAPLPPLVPVLVLGFAKIAVGLSRDRPVGFLLALVVFGLVALVGLMFRGGLLTTEGDHALKTLRLDRARVIRAPLRAEVPLAFALAGTVALAGTAYSAYASQVMPIMVGGSGCGGGDGGGGGGGGGGCGGCSG